MIRALHLKTTVLPGGRIEIVDQSLPVGESVDVVVSQPADSAGRSAVDILAEAPGPPRIQDCGGSCGVSQRRTGFMGALELPSDGPIYLDASAFIYSVERIEPYQALIEPLWQQARNGRFTVVSSELVVSEILVRPLREGNTRAEALFRSLLEASEVRLMAATRSLWERTARLRADSGLKTPDALHAASALQAGSTLFVTNDSDFRRVQGLPVTILDDLLEEEQP